MYRWNIVVAIAAVAFAFVQTSRAQTPPCGWQYHFNQLNGNPAQNCLSAYESRIFTEESISTVITRRSQARPSINMPAVCLNPIPCDWRNARREATLEHYTEWKVSVSGSASGTAKVSLGEALLRVLGLEVSLTVTVSGTVEYSQRNGYSDLLEIWQQDCHDQEWKFWKETSKVTGTVTEVEEYVWTLSSHWTPDGVNWYPCPPGPVTTRCTGASASGSASRETAIIVEQTIKPCCESLTSNPPCCGRVCPR